MPRLEPELGWRWLPPSADSHRRMMLVACRVLARVMLMFCCMLCICAKSVFFVLDTQTDSEREERKKKWVPKIQTPSQNFVHYVPCLT